jgi:uncharacterized protein (TIGR00730 family)
MMVKSICVFCGSNHGARPAYAAAAQALGCVLARRGIRLVYGGGHVGLMGALATAALEAGGQVTGVITGSLEGRELAHPGVADMRVVVSLAERKALMAELADAFVVLPGGFGTLDELFEVLVWAQFDTHRKPLGLLNVDGYYDPLVAWLDGAARERFVRAEHRTMVLVAKDAETLLERFAAYEAPRVEKWIAAG